MYSHLELFPRLFKGQVTKPPEKRIAFSVTRGAPPFHACVVCDTRSCKGLHPLKQKDPVTHSFVDHLMLFRNRYKLKVC